MRRLQPQQVADPHAERLAQILREHHTPTGEHLASYPVIQRVVQRIGGAGGKSVENDAGAADLSERERALDDVCDARQRAHFFGKTLRENVGGIAVRRICAHPYVDIRDRREDAAGRPDHVGARTIDHDRCENRDQHRHHGGPHPPRRTLYRRGRERPSRSEQTSGCGSGFDDRHGEREAKRDLGAQQTSHCDKDERAGVVGDDHKRHRQYRDSTNPACDPQPPWHNVRR